MVFALVNRVSRVPVEFLSDAQASAFGRFTGDPSRADLERFFYLDDADRELISERCGDHNRLGFAVQLGTVRFLGGLLVDPLDVAWLVVDYLAPQLGVSDPSVVKAYSQRPTTAREHAREIRQVYGYRDLAEPTTEACFLHLLSATARKMEFRGRQQAPSEPSRGGQQSQPQDVVAKPKKVTTCGVS